MSLSDKIWNAMTKDNVVDVSDIKKAIKELKDECLDIWVASKNKTEAIDSIIERINKKFGKELCE